MNGYSWRFVLLVYFVVGLLQTVFAYFLFDRPVDHDYFLQLANNGVVMESVGTLYWHQIKSQLAGFVFYWLCTPSRILGGHELTHILWLRVLALSGFLLAYRWVSFVVGVNSSRNFSDKNLLKFIFFILAYPGQLAWTASLLRDGVGCFALFLSLVEFWRHRWLIGVLSGLMAVALRPEFVLLFLLLFLPLPWSRLMALPRLRLLILVLVCFVFAMATFLPRSLQANFSEAAFGADGMSYPPVLNLFDVVGYLKVFSQAVLDPLPISNLSSGGVFHVAEVAYFIFIVVVGVKGIRRFDVDSVKVLFISFIIMWIFAYFEIFVSGFSRHRLALVLIVVAVYSFYSTRVFDYTNKKSCA